MKLGTSSIVAAVPVGVYCLLLLLLIGTGTSTVNACTLDGCDHPDCGSCGNACCSLLITVQESTEAVMHKLNQSITEEGGPDQLYLPMLTASGTMTFSDLRQYGAGADFLGQALHTTFNGKYNDTINLSLSPTTVLSKNKKKNKNMKGTIISAFSISDIAGAYCDSGQNYWNILQLMEGIQWDHGETPLIEHVGESCPTTTTTNSKTPPARVHKHKKGKEEETNNDGSFSEEEEPEDTSFSSTEEEDTDSAFSSSEEDIIPETTTTTTTTDDDVDDSDNENNFNALSKTMDTATTTTTDPFLRPRSMGKHFLLVVAGLFFLVSGSFALVLLRKKKQQAQRTSAAAHSTSSSFRENYGRL